MINILTFCMFVCVQVFQGCIHVTFIPKRRTQRGFGGLTGNLNFTSGSLPVMFPAKIIIFKFLVALSKMVMKLDLEKIHI